MHDNQESLHTITHLIEIRKIIEIIVPNFNYEDFRLYYEIENTIEYFECVPEIYLQSVYQTQRLKGETTKLPTVARESK